MGKCEQCGFLECRCPDHVDQNYIPKADLRKLVERMRNEIHSKGCGCNGCEMLREYAGKLEQLTEG